ncbi:MAG: sugar phosphate isomerase/epimerase family protein [Dysosmobacter sp.]|jgi:sugar phosphate isomerase/epimerase|uniref:sugar phosphate isomerase/epimerase family protein n=1 Tax=Dysosmobacter sp. TaxID=2591382 RepID=UPI003D90C3CE
MRPITITTGQYGDLSFAEVCRVMGQIGYDGLEIACHSHLDAHRYTADQDYRQSITKTLEENGLKVWALGAHLAGQCVGDNWDPRLDNFAPAHLSGKPEEIRKWAVDEMMAVARAAQEMGVHIVTGFTGSPIWPFWYSFPQTSQQMVDDGFGRIKELWTPIFDVFDECGVKFALEVHPTEIAFDYYSTQKLLDTFDRRPTLGINFDPSHLVWQGMDPCLFLRDFADRIYHVHMKDVKVRLDGRAGILGSHIEFGDLRRGWNFVSLGHGDVDFDGIIRELNAMHYEGPLSVEWEDSGMERMFGAREAYEFTRRTDFEPSLVAFDSALKKD